MRESLILVCLVAACGGDTPPRAPAPTKAVPWPVDGFLRYLPADSVAELRFPTQRMIETHTAEVDALLRAFGLTGAPMLGAAKPDGLAPDTAAGFALTAGGGWVHYLPARDKRALNRSLQSRLASAALREEGDWVVLSSAGAAPGQRQGEPLPPGDLAVRVHRHPLLAAFGNPGDQVELGLELGEAGFDCRGYLRPGAVTKKLLEQSHPGRGGLIDYLPNYLAIRIETTLPPTLLASFLRNRIAVHCGIKNGEDRVALDRFLREVLTAIDPEQGIALGVMFSAEGPSFVATGQFAEVPASPVLAKLHARDRSTYGAFVLDQAATSPVTAYRWIAGWFGWVIEANPKLDGLPESLWPLIGDLTNSDEDGGVFLGHGIWEDRFIVAAGPRAYVLVQGVARRLAHGTQRSAAATQLRLMRERGTGDYVLGVAVDGARLQGLADSDRAALRRAFHAGPRATPPAVVAVAGFYRDGELRIEGRVLY